MEKGDISNRVPPRILVVMDPLVIHIPPEREREAAWWMALRRYKRYLRCYTWDEHDCSMVRDMVWRRVQAVTLISLLPIWAEEELDRLADRHNLGAPVHCYGDQQTFTKALVFMPEVTDVVHNSHYSYQYGARSRSCIEDVML